MTNRTGNENNWLIDVFDDGAIYPDGGRDVHVTVTHIPTRMVIHAVPVCYLSDSDCVVGSIVHDDFGLPAHTAARLIAKLAQHYVAKVGRYGDCGLVDRVDLNDALHDRYSDTSEGQYVASLMMTAVRTFSTTDGASNDHDRSRN